VEPAGRLEGGLAQALGQVGQQRPRDAGTVGERRRAAVDDQVDGHRQGNTLAGHEHVTSRRARAGGMRA
jgi:hypothetical protein